MRWRDGGGVGERSHTFFHEPSSSSAPAGSSRGPADKKEGLTQLMMREGCFAVSTKADSVRVPGIDIWAAAFSLDPPTRPPGGSPRVPGIDQKGSGSHRNLKVHVGTSSCGRSDVTVTFCVASFRGLEIFADYYFASAC